MRPVYNTIYRDLLVRIEAGEYPYQSFIPSETELVKAYGCAHNTVRRALRILTQEGYVQPINGKGVRVIYLPTERKVFEMSGIETFKEAARRNRMEVVTKVLSIERVVVDEDFARQTGFSVGDEVTHVERVRYMNGKARILDLNWYLSSLVPGLTKEVAEDSIYAYVEGELGMRVTTSKRNYTAEKARKADRDLIDLGSYDFVAVVTNHTFNGDGIMFEYTQSRHHPRYFSFSTVALRDPR